MAHPSWNFAGAPSAELEKVRTWGAKTIEEMAGMLGVSHVGMLKTTAFHATSTMPVRWLLAVVRADHEIDLQKLASAAREMFGITALRPIDSPEAFSRWSSDFIGPDAAMLAPDAVMLVDPHAAQGGLAWIAGGNESDSLVKNFNWFRECGDRLADPAKVNVADIRLSAFYD
jgi:prolyl-tRNA synthetase